MLEICSARKFYIQQISPHYRSEGRRQGTGAIFLGEIGNLKYEKVARIFKESYTHHEEKFIILTLYGLRKSI